MLYSAAELPGVYADRDGPLLAVFDHVEAERRDGGERLRLTNPTAYDADVRLLAEGDAERREPLPLNPGTLYRRVRLAPGESRTIDL